MFELNIYFAHSLKEMFVLACVLWSFFHILLKLTKVIIQFNTDPNEQAFQIPEFLLCPKCWSFWFTLILTSNIYEASVVAVFVSLIEVIVVFLESNSKTKI